MKVRMVCPECHKVRAVKEMRFVWTNGYIILFLTCGHVVGFAFLGKLENIRDISEIKTKSETVKQVVKRRGLKVMDFGLYQEV